MQLVGVRTGPEFSPASDLDRQAGVEWRAAEARRQIEHRERACVAESHATRRLGRQAQKAHVIGERICIVLWVPNGLGDCDDLCAVMCIDVVQAVPVDEHAVVRRRPMTVNTMRRRDRPVLRHKRGAAGGSQATSPVDALSLQYASDEGQGVRRHRRATDDARPPQVRHSARFGKHVHAEYAPGHATPRIARPAILPLLTSLC